MPLHSTCMRRSFCLCHLSVSSRAGAIKRTLQYWVLVRRHHSNLRPIIIFIVSLGRIHFLVCCCLRTRCERARHTRLICEYVNMGETRMGQSESDVCLFGAGNAYCSVVFVVFLVSWFCSSIPFRGPRSCLLNAATYAQMVEDFHWRFLWPFMGVCVCQEQRPSGRSWSIGNGERLRARAVSECGWVDKPINVNVKCNWMTENRANKADIL